MPYFATCTNFNKYIEKFRTIILSFYFLGYRGREGIPKLAEEYMAGKLKLDEFVTHTMPLDKINEAFDLMHAGKRFVDWLSNCDLLAVESDKSDPEA